MDSLIQALGLDLRILLAQLVNFAILVFVLWRFAYRPLFDLLEKRRKKIEQSMKDSDEATIRLEKSIQESKEIIAQARQEASSIIEEAQKKGEARYQEVVAKTKEDVRVVIDQEKAKILAEKKNMVNEVKKELSSLLMLSLEKFLGEKMDEQKDKQVIEKIVKELQ